MIWKTWEIFLFVDAAYCSVKRFPLFNLRKGKSRWVLLDIFIVYMVCSSSFRCSFHRFSWFDYKDHEDVGNLNDFIVIQEKVVLGSIMTQLFCLVIFFRQVTTKYLHVQGNKRYPPPFLPTIKFGKGGFFGGGYFSMFVVEPGSSQW